MEIYSRGKPGFVWVIGETNGRSFMLEEYTISAGARSIVRSSVSVWGHSKRYVRSTSGNTFVNYPQVQGIVGGENALTLRLEASGDAWVRQLHVLKGSALGRAKVSPTPLKLRVPLGSRGLKVALGQTFSVPIVLQAEKRQPIGGVSVSATVEGARGASAGDGLEIVAGRQQVGTITDRASMAFRFRARRTGTYTILVRADSARNSPFALLRLVVVK